MGFHFRPAVRENVGLIIGISGASGAGKSYSAMRLATGIVGKGKRFAVIDTEARRALHYAGQFQFDHAELRPPFRPDSYVEAIKQSKAKVNPLPDTQRGAFEQATRPVHEQFRSAIGAELLDKAYKKIKELQAAKG